MATKKQRYMISVDDEMFKAIEDFRFERRFQTRSEATTELIRLGLKEIEKEKKDQEQKLHSIANKDSYLSGVYGRAAAFGGDSARIPVPEENLKELLRRSAKEDKKEL